jgi:hypothetical protein
MHKSFRLIAPAVVAVTVTTGLAACGSSTTGAKSTPAAASTSSASTKPILTVPSLTGVETSVTLDSNLLPTLTSLHVTPAPTGTGTLTMPGGAATLNFPITGGHVTIYKKGAVTPYVQGIINHDGSGLSLTAGGKTLTVENFAIDPGTSMLTAQVKQMNDAAIPLFFLDGSDLQITPPNADGVAKLDGTKVELTSQAADAINTYFGVTAFKARMLIGIAHIQAKG